MRQRSLKPKLSFRLGAFLRNHFNAYVAITLIILNLTGPLQGTICAPAVVEHSLVGSTRLALSRFILGSVLLALLPSAPVRGGTMRDSGEPASQSVIEFEPVASEYLKRDCLLASDLTATSVAPRCPTTELRITRYIDHFLYQPDTLVHADANNPTSFRAFPARVLGGERDVQVKQDAGTGVIESEILKPDLKIKDTDIVHRQIEGSGNTLIVWDGPDGKPEIQTNGLGEIDFRQWNADRFIIRVSATDRPGNLVITVYDSNDKAKISQATIRYDEKEPREFALLFDSLRPTGPKGRANLSSVGAVSLTIVPDVIEGQLNSSTRIDFIALAGPQCVPCLTNDGPFFPSGGSGACFPSGSSGSFPGGYSSFAFSTPVVPLLPLFFPGGGGGWPPYGPPDQPPPHYPPPPDCGPPPSPSVPEPGTLTLALISVASLGAYRVVRNLVYRIR